MAELLMDEYYPCEHNTPSKRRRARLMAYYERQVEEKVQAEYEATKRVRESFSMWCQRRRNELVTQILDRTYEPVRCP